MLPEADHCPNINNNNNCNCECIITTYLIIIHVPAAKCLNYEQLSSTLTSHFGKGFKITLAESGMFNIIRDARAIIQNVEVQLFLWVYMQRCFGRVFRRFHLIRNKRHCGKANFRFEKWFLYIFTYFYHKIVPTFKKKSFKCSKQKN